MMRACINGHTHTLKLTNTLSDTQPNIHTFLPHVLAGGTEGNSIENGDDADDQNRGEDTSHADQPPVCMYVCVENLRYTYTMYTRHSSPSIYVSIYRFAVGCFGVGELGGWLSGAQGRVVVSSLLFLLRCCLKVDKSNGMGWRGVYLQVEEGIMEALLSRVSWLSLSVVCT